jgi:CII-binding regulator of phage lambda lysogenization HflD
MTTRALQLRLARYQSELLSTKHKLLRNKSVIKIIDDRILNIKKTRFDLSVNKDKDKCHRANVSFGSFFWDKNKEELKNIFTY